MKIIVNADDFGLDNNRNKAILYAFYNGICTTSSIIVNTIGTEEAVIIAKENGLMNKIGLHLNLTTGEPLTEGIKKVKKYCSNGYFIGENPRSFSKVFCTKYIKHIYEEFEAQINKYLDFGFTSYHLDTHNDIGFNLPVLYALKPLLKKYNFKSIRGVEPYLFGFYRKSIVSYLPLKYYFMFCYKYYRQFGETVVLNGGRNVNQFFQDIRDPKFKKNGNILDQSIIEVIIHPDFRNGEFVDLTNFDKNKNIFSLENTNEKLEGFGKIDYSQALKK